MINNDKQLNVLSLFDGISCGHLALNKAGFFINNYFSSEIDKVANQISNFNFPANIPLGNVFNIDCSILPNIDLLIGGNPCQYWSKAKNFKAKNEREITPDGIGWSLFTAYENILHIVNPKYFLLENNANISQKIQDEISNCLGVSPILIDSALLSAQTRKRLYWTNIPNVSLPEDKGISFGDIAVFDQNLFKTDIRIEPTLKYSKNYVKWDISRKGYFSQQDRAYFAESKAPTVPRCRTETKVNLWLGNNTYKKTCPLECERLQTLPTNYTKFGKDVSGNIIQIPKTKRFEAIGNCWTVDVIAHILSFMKF